MESNAPPVVVYPDPIPHIIPFKSICLLSGPPHRGKTALIVTLLARILRHQTVFGLATHAPVRVGFLVTDHDHKLNQSQWLARAGILDQVTLYSLRNDPTFSWKRLRKIEERIGVFQDCLAHLALPPGSLLITDPVALFISSRLNDYHSVAVGLGELHQTIQAAGLTLLGTAHTGKQTDDPKRTYKRPIDRIMGSGAQIGFCDTAMALVGPDDIEKPYYELSVSPSMSPEFTFKYGRDANGLFVPYIGLDDVGDTPETDRPTQIAMLIPEEGIDPMELVEIVMHRFEISRRQVFRDLKVLKERQLIIHDPQNGKYYRRKLN
jgi:hypothetical protein